MPVNEILAASYCKVKYHVLENRPHVFRLYFDTVPIADGADGYLFEDYTDAGHPDGWHLNEIIEETFTRVAEDSSRATEKIVENVEMWQSASGANVFMGFDAGDYTGIDTASASPVASAYSMYVFQSVQRYNFRLQFFDTADPKPQRFGGTTPPSVDNGFIDWWMCRSAVGFVTNDGYALQLFNSQNTGYNRKLSRIYGREIIP